MPPRPGSSEEAERRAENAGLDEEAVLGELHYRISSDWSEREEDNSETADMISRIYVPQEKDGGALDVMRKGISLVERDALAEGKRNLGSVGQFIKQWESTYGISITQEMTDRQLPSGADQGWAFESVSDGRGGRGMLLLADMYLYAVYYAAEDSANNAFRDIWADIAGSVWIERP